MTGYDHSTTLYIERDEIEIPIEIEYKVAPAEPDVGILSEYIDDWRIDPTSPYYNKLTEEEMLELENQIQDIEIEENDGPEYEGREPD